jgi:CubicO group peptidase (beta-lactamase class C family)
MRTLLIALIALFSFSCQAHARHESLNNRINELMKESEAIGVSVIAVKGNRICYQESFGYNPDYNDTTKRVPIKRKDVFRIASISKTFVATAIMQLVEKGQINLDDDINKYLSFEVRNPRYPDVPITVRMLLCHRSSIIDNQFGKYRFRLDMFIQKDVKDKIPFFEEYKPGTKYKYSNYGYNLLGAIIENVTQTRFDTYIEKNILKPLRIKGSFNVSKIDSKRFVWAYSYDKQKKKYVKSPSMYKSFEKEVNDYVLGESTAIFSPCEGMKLSARDLAKYMRVHMNYGKYRGARILTRESEELLWKTVSNVYGLGFWHSNLIRGVDLIGHDGDAFGIHSAMFFNPKEKYGFIVICNGCNSGQVLWKQIVTELYKSFIQ